MERRLSGFTLTISWLSSLSSSAGQCSSVQPRSLYEDLPFELPKDQVGFELSASATSLFCSNSESRLVFAEFLLFLLRSFVRMVAIANNRRQISRSSERGRMNNKQAFTEARQAKQDRGGNAGPEQTTGDG